MVVDCAVWAGVGHRVGDDRVSRIGAWMPWRSFLAWYRMRFRTVDGRLLIGIAPVRRVSRIFSETRPLVVGQFTVTSRS